MKIASFSRRKHRNYVVVLTAYHLHSNTKCLLLKSIPVEATNVFIFFFLECILFILQWIKHLMWTQHFLLLLKEASSIYNLDVYFDKIHKLKVKCQPWDPGGINGERICIELVLISPEIPIYIMFFSLILRKNKCLFDLFNCFIFNVVDCFSLLRYILCCVMCCLN